MSVFSNSKIKVAVIRGGASPEYNSSLSTGEHVLHMLREKPEIYEPIDIFISREGDWHVGGIRKEPYKTLEYSDVIFNALHGTYGEGGNVQRLLSSLNIPHTGSMAFSSVMSLNKDIAKNFYMNHGLSTPRFETITADDEIDKLVAIFQNYLHPVVVKPNTENNRRGVKLAYTFEELVKAVDEALTLSQRVIVEEFIRGKEAKCGVIEDFRGEKLYALLPIEVATPRKNRTMLDYEQKFNSAHEYLSPSTFTPSENKVLEHVAKKAHEALGFRHYSSSDLIMTPQGKIYVLESSPLPDFSKDSNLHRSLQEVGSSADDFLSHILKLALEAK